MQSLFIVLLGVLSAVVYGIVHDQVTARVCLEYFTVFHPNVFATNSPTLLALGWGVLATWWLGLTLGIALAVSARFGARPRRAVRSLLRPVGLLMLATACSALLAGLSGYVLAWVGIVGPELTLAEQLPVERHACFVADLWAHTASYLFAIVGGTALITDVWRSRRPVAARLPVFSPRRAQADTVTILAISDTVVMPWGASTIQPTVADTRPT